MRTRHTPEYLATKITPEQLDAINRHFCQGKYAPVRAPYVPRVAPPNECLTCEGSGEEAYYRGVAGEGMDAEPCSRRCEDCDGRGFYQGDDE